MDQGQKILGGIVVSVTMMYFFWGCMQTDILEQLVSSSYCFVNFLYNIKNDCLQHDSIPNEVYNAETIWNKDKKYFSIVTSSRCRKKFRLTAMGFFNLSCASFREVCGIIIGKRAKKKFLRKILKGVVTTQVSRQA